MEILTDVLAMSSAVGGTVGTWVLLDRRLTIFVTKHDALEARMAAVERRNAELAKDHGVISKEVSGLARDVNAQTERVDDMDDRVDDLSQKVDSGIGLVLAEMKEMHAAVRIRP